MHYSNPIDCLDWPRRRFCVDRLPNAALQRAFESILRSDEARAGQWSEAFENATAAKLLAFSEMKNQNVCVMFHWLNEK